MPPRPRAAIAFRRTCVMTSAARQLMSKVARCVVERDLEERVERRDRRIVDEEPDLELVRPAPARALSSPVRTGRRSAARASTPCCPEASSASASHSSASRSTSRRSKPSAARYARERAPDPSRRSGDERVASVAGMQPELRLSPKPFSLRSSSIESFGTSAVVHPEGDPNHGEPDDAADSIEGANPRRRAEGEVVRRRGQGDHGASSDRDCDHRFAPHPKVHQHPRRDDAPRKRRALRPSRPGAP